MKQLPDHLDHYNTTKTFTDVSAPDIMKDDHRTKAGVWGRIVVVKGEVIYCITETGERISLTPDQPGIIEPTIAHKIDPQPGTEFFVEFYR